MDFLNPALSVVPGGMLDAFGIQNTGRYPQQITQYLQPMIELRDWYFVERAQRRTFTAQNLGALGSSLTWDVAVPPGEIWYVHQMVVAVQLLAADNVQLCHQVQDPSSSAYLRSPVASSRGVASILSADWGGFWARPGAQFQTVILANTAPSAAAAGGWVYFTPFRR